MTEQELRTYRTLIEAAAEVCRLEAGKLTKRDDRAMQSSLAHSSAILRGRAEEITVEIAELGD